MPHFLLWNFFGNYLTLVSNGSPTLEQDRLTLLWVWQCGHMVWRPCHGGFDASVHNWLGLGTCIWFDVPLGWSDAHQTLFLFSVTPSFSFVELLWWPSYSVSNGSSTLEHDCLMLLWVWQCDCMVRDPCHSDSGALIHSRLGLATAVWSDVLAMVLWCSCHSRLGLATTVWSDVLAMVALMLLFIAD